MKNLYKILFLCSIYTLTVACGDSDGHEDPVTPTPTPTPEQPTLATPTVSNITESSATVTTTVTGSTTGMTRHGFCYGISANPDTGGATADLITGWSTSLTNLQAGMTYYVRAFLTNAAGTVYSQQTSFTTTGSTTPEDPWASYKVPNYADDYRNFSSWNDRSKWNLANVHDPTVMLADDGYYYMYQTDASFGNAHASGGHFHCRRSKNLVDWEYLGGTMGTPPTWVKDTLNNSRARFGLPAIANPQYGYWAPCARKVRTGLYRMYYCIVVDNYIKTGLPNTAQNFDKSWTERAFIGVMETSDPASNKWEDKGFVLSSMSDRGKNWSRSSLTNWDGYFRYNAIDPTYIITGSGEHWLIFGSWHSGFAALQVNGDTGKPISPMPEFCTTLAELNKVMKRVYTRTNNSRWQGSEAPEVVYHNGYYYLFMAYDGLDVPYNTRVARSANINGPYQSYQGTDLTNGGDAFPIITHPYKFSGDAGWVGISHCAIWEDGKGNWFYSSQGRFPVDYPVQTNWAPNAVMMGHVRRLLWTEDGWPVVLPERYGAVPEVAITESELVGEWENISLTYNYGKQCTSVNVTLNADNTVSGGPFNNTKWSFDATKNILTIGQNKLCVAREVDWEAKPRHVTIVYAGYTPAGRGNPTTYWGKKK